MLKLTTDLETNLNFKSILGRPLCHLALLRLVPDRPPVRVPHHRQDRKGPSSDPRHPNPASLQAGATLCRAPIALLHSQAGSQGARLVGHAHLRGRANLLLARLLCREGRAELELRRLLLVGTSHHHHGWIR